MSVIVKTRLGDDIRRFSLEGGSFKKFQDTLLEIYPGSKFSMSYRDDEGDDVRITHSDEFDEALRIARTMDPPLLRIVLVSVSIPPAPAAAAAAAVVVPKPVISPPPVATQGALKTLDQIQEKIAQNLSELRNLSASFEARKAAIAAVPVPAPTRISEQCSELSRQIAEQCVSLSRELPRYTERITEEIASQCKGLCDEVSRSTRQATAETVTAGQDARAAVGTLCQQDSKRAAGLAEFTPAPVDTALELSRQIEQRCAALVAETRANCTSISDDISKMVMKL